MIGNTYYRTPEGRIKKRALNRRRYEVSACEASEVIGSDDSADAACEDESIVAYVCLLIALIAGIAVGRAEVEALRTRISRQHSLRQGGRFDYRVEQLNKDPPPRLC